MFKFTLGTLNKEASPNYHKINITVNYSQRTNKIKLTNYFILRMRVFIQNFTYGEKGVKCRGKKFTSPKC